MEAIVKSWMVEELHLSGNSLLCYAVINTATLNGGGGEAILSVAMFENITGASRGCVISCLKSLHDCGHIVKRVVTDANGVQWNAFKTTRKDEVQIVAPTKAEKSGRFTPPTLDAVEQYLADADLQIDAKAFLSYYEANGWMVGKNKMRNWKAAVNVWAIRETNDKKVATVQTYSERDEQRRAEKRNEEKIAEEKSKARQMQRKAMAQAEWNNWRNREFPNLDAKFKKKEEIELRYGEPVDF